MSQEAAAAVVAPPEVEETPATKKKPPKRKPLPPHAVVVLNDDLHTFNYVIEVFMKVFGYSEQKSFLLAKEIHEQGRSIVWSGSKEVAQLKRDLIRSAGPDIYATAKVEFPLGVVVEPLPG